MTTMSRLLETLSKSLGFLTVAFSFILTNSRVETQTSYVSSLGASFRGHSDENFFSCERTNRMSEMRNYKSFKEHAFPDFDKQEASSLSSQLKLMAAIKLHRKWFACRITKHSLRDFEPSLCAARSAEECLAIKINHRACYIIEMIFAKRSLHSRHEDKMRAIWVNRVVRCA